MVSEERPFLYVDSEYWSEHGNFKILLSSRLGNMDHVEIRLTENTKKKMEYFCPLPGTFHINLPGKSILTDEDRGNKKQGKISLIKLQRKFLYNHHEIDTKGLVNTVNYSLSIMRSSPLYHRNYTSK